MPESEQPRLIEIAQQLDELADAGLDPASVEQWRQLLEGWEPEPHEAAELARVLKTLTYLSKLRER